MRSGDQVFPDADIEVAMVADEQLDSEKPYIFANKMRFAWKSDDKEVLDRVRRAADAVFQRLFADSIEVIDRFYAQMRVPRINPNTGQVIRGADGRPIWQIDADTQQPIERLDQLTGQDMDQAILDLERILLAISPQMNQLRLEALFAQNAAKDSFDDAWVLATGTQGEHNARSSIDSRTERWHSYFRYYIYSTANTFFQEIKQFSRKLENIRYRQVQSQG